MSKECDFPAAAKPQVGNLVSHSNIKTAPLQPQPAARASSFADGTVRTLTVCAPAACAPVW